MLVPIKIKNNAKGLSGYKNTNSHLAAFVFISKTISMLFFLKVENMESKKMKKNYVKKHTCRLFEIKN